jgi:SAM-dependent methyltransferase
VFENLKRSLRRFRAYRAARFGYHFATDRTFRTDHLQLLRGTRRLYQYRSITSANRYPRIFALLGERLRGVPSPRILSFGCATGEEVFTLREYLPQAHVKGVDINPANIARCLERRRDSGGDPLAEFEVAGTAAGETPGSYDAVLAMAVFQRPQLKTDPSIASCEKFIRFADFELAVAELASCVKPGGYLAIAHSAFRFADTAAAADFSFEMAIEPPAVFFPRFDRDNRRIPGLAPEQVVFRRRQPG